MDFNISDSVREKFRAMEEGYVSPIMIEEQMPQIDVDDGIVKAVMKIGVDVNKGELIKALKYDRDQYMKGYEKGFLAGCNNGEKTADEMFRELGYEKASAPYHQIIYENKSEKMQIIYFYGCGYFECFYDGGLICMSSKEVLACAQLIREMEANNEAD